jgi:kynurenine formamidase
VEHGVHIIETLALEEIAAAGVSEFVFVLSPLKIVGGTGSPVRPIAVVAA